MKLEVGSHEVRSKKSEVMKLEVGSHKHMEKISSLLAARCTTILLWALIGKF